MVCALACLVVVVPRDGLAQDWPQWRGAARDAKALAFNAPKTWPEALTKRWSVAVGEGVASPALVGDRLYVFSRQDGYEVLRCLTAANGQQQCRRTLQRAARQLRIHATLETVSSIGVHAQPACAS